ncbi:MAG TPA: hypothetical protein VN773_05305 [Verrucomicrobiae bacterium]|jgi:hypothetical protein|nr:hypothetical protein [Verrucomicrobiae bacterium]
MATATPSIGSDAPHDEGHPFIEVGGVEGSRLRVTQLGLTVLPRPGTMSDMRRDGRFWAYGLIQDVRLEESGSMGIVRARVRSTGGEVPLLLLEPDQIAAAQRALEMVWNLMGAMNARRIGA